MTLVSDATHYSDEIPEADGLYTVDEQSYHRDRGSLSVSGAKLLLPPSCPAKFKERMDNPPPPKPHFDFGSIVHTLTPAPGPTTWCWSRRCTGSEGWHRCRQPDRHDGMEGCRRRGSRAGKDTDPRR